MGGLFGDVHEQGSNGVAVVDAFYGTDFHSHLGTQRGGLASSDGNRVIRFIHDITNAQFRSKFESELAKLKGNRVIGAISDTEDQPLVLRSHLGEYALASVNRVDNLDALVRAALSDGRTHFAETGSGLMNPTEVVSTLIDRERSFVEGIGRAQREIDGSCSMLLLAREGIYAARDRLGRTPLVLGRKEKAYAVASESFAFSNVGFDIEREIGPGEIVLINEDGFTQVKKPEESMQICSFLWVYYGFPASKYEGINVEVVRNRAGAALARADKKDLDSGALKVDLVAGIPDSGTGHAIGYSNESGIPFGRPFAKYTPTWPRSFMPQNQEVRKLVARMKLVPIKELISGRSLLFCEDSIVRGTQLGDTIDALYSLGAREVHMRPACPPLVYGCKFLNFSRSDSELELAGQRAIVSLEGLQRGNPIPREMLGVYANPDSEKYGQMVEWIRRDLRLTTLKYQRLGDLVEAIGMPKDRLCTHCWDGSGRFR